MRSSVHRFRPFILVSLAFVFALAPPVWGAERIQLPGHLPIGETPQYNLVYFSNRSFLPNINQAGELTPATTTGRILFSYADQLLDDRLSFEYHFQNFAYREPSYVAAGIMSTNARFSGHLGPTGDVLAAELHPRLFDLGLYLEHIFELTVFVPPTYEVAVGDSWSRSIQTATTSNPSGASDALGTVSVDITYTLQDIDRNAGVAQIVVEEKRTHLDIASDATEQHTVRRESVTFGIIEVSLETGHVLSAVAHNRLEVTRIPPYGQAFEGSASIDRLQMLNDIRLERVSE